MVWGVKRVFWLRKYNLDVSDLVLELLQLLLQSCMFLCHFFIFLLPLIALILEGLNLAFEMSGLDISLSKPVIKMLAGVSAELIQYDKRV